MPSFGRTSKANLATCHRDIRIIMQEVIKHYDCKVLEGHRGEQKQNQLFKHGKSKLKFPYGKHNTTPSEAIDTAPYPVSWANTTKNLARFYHLAGRIMAIADMLKKQGVITHSIRFGGDWDSDDEYDDQTFDDLVHFELRR